MESIRFAPVSPLLKLLFIASSMLALTAAMFCMMVVSAVLKDKDWVILFPVKACKLPKPFKTVVLLPLTPFMVKLERPTLPLIKPRLPLISEAILPPVKPETAAMLRREAALLLLTAKPKMMAELTRLVEPLCVVLLPAPASKIPERP